MSKINDHPILNGVREAIKHLNRFPTVKEYDEFADMHKYPSYAQVIKHTSLTWKEIQASFGLPKTDISNPDFIIEKLKEAARDLGDFFSKDEYDAWRKQKGVRSPSASQIWRVFRSWNKAKEAAGLQLHPIQTVQERYSEQDCINALKTYMKETGSKVVKIEEYNEWRHKKRVNGEKYPSDRTILSKFNHFVLAVEAAGGRTFGSVDEEEYFINIMEYIATVLNYDAYNEWAEQKGKINAQSMQARGVDVMSLFRRAVNAHLKKSFNTLKLKNK